MERSQEMRLSVSAKRATEIDGQTDPSAGSEPAASRRARETLMTLISARSESKFEE